MFPERVFNVTHNNFAYSATRRVPEVCVPSDRNGSGCTEPVQLQGTAPTWRPGRLVGGPAAAVLGAGQVVRVGVGGSAWKTSSNHGLRDNSAGALDFFWLVHLQCDTPGVRSWGHPLSSFGPSPTLNTPGLKLTPTP